MAMMRLRREDPRIVGPYRLHRRLGAGGMGVVYLGSDRRGQRVALKLIRAELAEDLEFRTRFAREIAAASRIRGGCTARVVGSDIEADRPWLATAYVPGPSLYKQVGDEGPLSWPEAARIGAALADGLVKVHEAGVVHRDLKPSNILLSPRGPRIIDFGIAWSRGASTLTHVGTAVGSPGFLAPEQVRGAAVTPATDVFAFGATLAYALTGDTPFGSGASSEVMLYRVVHEEPDLSAVPPQLAPLIRACLAKEPAERPGAAALHERLSELAARGAAAGAVGGATRTARPGRGAVAPAPQDGARQNVPAPGRSPEPPASARARAAAGRPGAQASGGAGRRPQGMGAPLPRPEPTPVTRPLRTDRPDRPQTPPSARPGTRDRARPRERQHTPAPGGRPGSARQRLLRQRLVVFVTVTIGVALAIAAAQGCENRSDQGLRPPAGTVASAKAGTGGGGEQAVPGTSVDVAPPPSVPQPPVPQPSATPLPVAARSGAAADGALTPPQGPVPAVDWPNRSYPDGAGGPAIALKDGHSVGAGPQVALSAVLPARYKSLPAAVVVLRRAEGSAPVDLVQLYTFAGDTPVATTSRTSAADPQATAAWRLDGSTVVREERVAATGAVTSTRYTVRADGTLDESWPGAGAGASGGLTPPPAAAPAPPTAAAG
ncbi:Serine/threonine protein kinase [Streptomyces sp. 1331.2]|nr:Serine/threonine protein kinase [Streptomyces sp. 1331.2]